MFKNYITIKKGERLYGEHLTNLNRNSRKNKYRDKNLNCESFHPFMLMYLIKVSTKPRALSHEPPHFPRGLQLQSSPNFRPIAIPNTLDPIRKFNPQYTSCNDELFAKISSSVY